tara:strand:- start:6010 stop:6150 length:141 start_codon:yes stop_codon:yes gene_type:complete
MNKELNEVIRLIKIKIEQRKIQLEQEAQELLYLEELVRKAESNFSK